MKILVFTTDLPPVPGLATSGTALRTYGLAQGLKAHGHEVLLSPPRSAVESSQEKLDRVSLTPLAKQQFEEYAALAFDVSNQSDVVQQLRPDAILCGHWPAMTLTVKPSQALIIDLAGPHILERHYQGSGEHQDAVLGKLSVLAAADYFIVSGASQRLYFLSYLNRAAVQEPEKRIVQITMPLPPESPPHQREGEFPQLLFGGVFLPWQDPSPGLDAAVAALSQYDCGHLKMIGGAHPSYPIKGGVYEALFEKLAQHPRVSTSGMLPYEAFVSEMGKADVAVDLMRWNLERQLAVTIRSTTYLWAGVPVLYNDYADLADLIAQYDAGWTVDPSSETAIKAAFREIFSDQALVKQKSENASKLARECFSWDRAVEPLLALFRAKTDAARPQTDIYFDLPENAEIELSPDSPVEQHFITRLPGLQRIACRLATGGKPCEVPVRMQLLDKKDARVIAEKTFEPDSIHNNDWIALDTEPLADSAGKELTLRIETSSPSSTKLNLWALNSSPYPMCGLFAAGRKLPHHSLCFRTTCVQ